MKTNITKIVRNNSGTSLVSLLVATLIMALVATGIMGLVSLNTAESAKAFTRADSINASRVALDKVGRLVRMARNIGDVQGTTCVASDSYMLFPPGPSGDRFSVNDNKVDATSVAKGTNCSSSALFPSTADSFYGPNAPAATSLNSKVASWPWGGGINNPYLLDQKTLIVQVQCFDPNGMPYCVTGSQKLPATDTYVFKVIPDTNKIAAGATKYYALQMAVFPAAAGMTNAPPNMQAGIPQTLLTGLVGPLDSNGEPAIFQYLSSPNDTVTCNFDRSNASGMANELVLPTFKGVILNLMVMNVDGRGKANVLTSRGEFFLRNNSQASLIGPSS